MKRFALIAIFLMFSTNVYCSNTWAIIETESISLQDFTLDNLIEKSKIILSRHQNNYQFGQWTFDSKENSVLWSFGQIIIAEAELQWKYSTKQSHSTLTLGLKNVAELIWIGKDAVLRARVRGQMKTIVMANTNPLSRLTKGLPAQIALLSVVPGCQVGTYSDSPCECKNNAVYVHVVKLKQLTSKELSSLQQQILAVLPVCTGVYLEINDRPVFPGSRTFPLLYPFSDDGILSIPQIDQVTTKAMESYVLRWPVLHNIN
jgi:hypothetical protein